MSTASEDTVLLQRIRSGERSAMANFLERRRPQLLAFIHKNLSDTMKRKVDPEDIAQEVCIECMRAFDDVEIGDRDPFGWICQIAERRIIDAHRYYFGTQKRDAARELPLGSPGGDSQQAGLINLLVASMTSPSQAFSREQREFRMLEAIQTLPEENQEVLRLRYVENLPSKEIAQRLQKSDVAIRVMLSRSLNKLKEVLNPDGE